MTFKPAARSGCDKSVDQSPQTVFVVTGMHRGGTSVLTRGLLSLGIPLGDTLLKRSESENPKGYWEDIDILAFSDKVLDALGRRWSSVEPLMPAQLVGETLMPLIDEGAALLSAKMEGQAEWGFKNPRTGPLLPFWMQVFDTLGLDTKHLFVVRNPRDVAQSLAARNRFSIGYGYALWTTHCLDTVRSLSEQETVFVSYERVMSDPMAQLRRIAERLNRDWNDAIASDVKRYAKEFVSKDLNHFDSDISELQADELCFPETQKLYGKFAHLCQRMDSPWTADTLAEFSELDTAWRRRNPLLSTLDSHEAGIEYRLKQLDEKVKSQHQHLSAQEKRIAEQHHHLSVQETLIEQMRGDSETEAARVKEEKDRLEAQIAAGESHLQSAQETIQTGLESIESLKTELATNGVLLDAARNAIEAQKNDNRSIQKKLLQAESNAENLAAALKEAEAAHEDRERELRMLLEDADRVARDRAREVTALREELSDRADHLRNLNNAINILKTDRTKLESIIDGFDSAVESLLNSSRWRTGNAIGEFKRRLFRQPAVPMASHFLKDLSIQFNDWRNRDRIADPALGQPGVQDAARILSGNRPAATSRKSTSQADLASQGVRTASALANLPNAPPVTILVPIYNAAEDVRRCVSSLFRNTTMEATLCLINDASTDPSIAAQLQLYARHQNVELLTNESNLGFTGTVNRGLRHAASDVIVLNSDTIVGPRWLENLRYAAYSDETVGTVTAISDNAGAFSFPVPGSKNSLPTGLCDDDISRLVFQNSDRVFPDVPTGNGFCLFIKRALLDRIGVLDIENFPRGYGEENDFCMRALAAGYRNLIDDSTYVFHREGSSFKESREALMQAGMEKIQALYPNYNGLVAAAFSSTAMGSARQTIKHAFDTVARTPVTVRPRTLVMLHRAEGGMNQTAFDLLTGLAPLYESVVLLSDGKSLTLLSFEEGALRETGQIVLDEPIVDCRAPNTAYRRAFAEILQDHRIELVHMHHLLSSCLEICEVLREFEIPLVLSLHDFFYVCPTVNLLDQDGVYCAGQCTAGDGVCPVPFQTLAAEPGLKHGWVKAWRQQVGGLLAMADRIVAPSQHVVEVYQTAFPNLDDTKLNVIEHGRNIELHDDCANEPRPDTPIRILVPGVISRHKGADFIESLAKQDGGKRLEFHFMGRLPPQLEGVGTEHGSYEVTEFSTRVRDIEPSFIGVFSTTSETYGHVLTESWACGVPVLVLDIGTQADRVGSHGGGAILDHRDVAAAYRKILQISDDPEAYGTLREGATFDGIPTIEEMASEYDRLYRRVQNKRLAFRASKTGSATGAGADGLLRVAMLPQRDQSGSAISSSHIRMLLPLAHTVARHKIDAVTTSYPELFETDAAFDVVVVQRTAVAEGQASRFIDACRERKTPFVLDIDDDLTALSTTHVESTHYANARQDLGALIANAAIVIASTPILAARLQESNARTTVVPNTLDERTWFAPLDQSTVRRREHDGIGLLFMGTETHSEDLRLLKQALEGLDHLRDSIGLELFVIGGEPKQEGQDWYTRLDVPLDCRSYPEFVAWLRSYQGHWDIGLAPLTGSDFNRAKSHLKYLEYAALDLPGIYADLAPYNESVRHERTGLLAADSPGAWSEAISALATSVALRDEIAEAAREDVLANHLLGDAAERLVAEITAAASSKD